MKPYSIVRRLITTVLLVEFISALCVAGIALVYERHVHFQSFDIMLRGRADLLLGAVQDAEDTQDNVMLDGTEVSLPAEDIYEVRDAHGRLLGRSRNWSGPSNAIFAVEKDGFFRFRIDGKHYRAFLLHGVRVVDPGDVGGGIPRHVTILYGAPTIHVWRAVLDAVEFYALASLLLMAVTGIVMAWLLNRGMAPVRELAAEAAGVSADTWQFNPSEEARMVRELAPLEQALQNVLHGLEQSFVQQRRFVSDAAHELKTAVAVVKSSLQLLRMKQRTAEEYQVGLDRCQADCARMEEIVLKMLALARVENASAATSPAPLQTDISVCVRQTVEQLAPIAEMQRLQVIASVPEQLLVALSVEDCGLLCSNLLLNALQHSPAGASIFITVEQQGRDAELRLEDQGSGIDPVALPHLYERFYRDDPSRNRNTGGTGLGLAICKAIVDQAQGSIQISSTMGIGTTVTVRLPLALPNLTIEAGKA
ncbi:MAG: sensor histidine kinase [Acidobacteriaceae bacterium]